MATAAKELWAAALGSADPRLSILDQVTVLVSDLPDQLLGATTGNTIVLDSTAAGWGWFVDPTPLGNSEFPIGLSSGVYAATPGSPAYGHMDLLTTLVHEFGNAMGFAEDQGQDVSGATLQAGVRRIPTAPTALAGIAGDTLITVPVSSNPPGVNLSNGFASAAPASAGNPLTNVSLGLTANTLNGTGLAGAGLPAALTGNAQVASLVANSAVTSGLPGMAPVSSAMLSFAAPATPSGSFVILGSALTMDLGGNLSGPSAIPPFVPASEPSLAEHHSRLLNTSGARPDAGEASMIDWGSAGLGTSNQLGSSNKDSQDWLDDFLNHLGLNQTQRNPNAGISVRPTAVGA
jgi:hypothetical protein